MSRYSESSNQPATSLPVPDVIGVLPPVPDGEENLLPKDAWLRPLRVEFGWWEDPVSLPDFTDVVQLIWDGDEANPVAVKQYDWSNYPDPPLELWLEVPVSKLDEGVHTLYYRLLPWNGSMPQSSLPVNVTIDKTAPRLAPSSQLIFPPAVLPPNQVTDRYLQANDDQLKADLPAYTTPRPWDRIEWFWGTGAGDFNSGGVIVLDDRNYADPVVVTIPGDLIRARGDGQRFVQYRVQDRAGNTSTYSAHVQLSIAATPIPRTLPPSKVKEATGGASSGVLSPSNAISGVTVVIPPEAVIYDGEPVFVQWAEQGSAGGYRTDIPTPVGSREYKIPSDKVAFHVGKSLPVRYEVFETGVVAPYISQPYTLRVEALGGMPTVQCDKVSGARLSVGSIADGGYASFTLERWTLMSTNQYITIKVIGVGSNSQALEIPVLTEFPVPEVAQTIAVGRISKADLQRFKLNVGFEVRVSVSFDGKETWQRFPSLTPTLVA